MQQGFLVQGERARGVVTDSLDTCSRGGSKQQTELRSRGRSPCPGRPAGHVPSAEGPTSGLQWRTSGHGGPHATPRNQSQTR